MQPGRPFEIEGALVISPQEIDGQASRAATTPEELLSAVDSSCSIRMQQLEELAREVSGLYRAMREAGTSKGQDAGRQSLPVQ